MLPDETGAGMTNPETQVADGVTAPITTEPETIEYVVSEKSKYKVPKDFKMPENLDKAFRSKEEHIQRLESELQSTRMGAQQNELYEKLEQLVTSSGGKKEPDDPMPDIVSNPQEYTDWIRRQAAKDGAEQGRQAFDDKYNTAMAQALTEELFKEHGESARADKLALWEKLIRSGDAVKVGQNPDGSPIFRIDPERVEMRYHHMYHDRLIKAAEERGLKKAQEVIGKAAGAPGSIPGSLPGNTAIDYDNLTEEQQAAVRFEESKRTPPPGGKLIAP